MIRSRTAIALGLAVAGALVAAFTLIGRDHGKPPAFQGWIEANLIFVGPDEFGRVETLAVREGDHVTVGAPLFSIDADLQRADLQIQEAALENAKVAYDRAVQLLKNNAGPQKNVDDAEMALRTAQARVNSSQTHLARRKVASPVEGTIEQVYYRVGELVPAGRPVVAVLPPGNLKVRFYVDETRLAAMKIGETVNVECDGCGNDIAGKISFIARSSEFTPPVIYSPDERHKLVYLIEALPNEPERLRVGQPVTVTLAAPAPQAIQGASR
jgi:HlyD family secretion protein